MGHPSMPRWRYTVTDPVPTHFTCALQRYKHFFKSKQFEQNFPISEENQPLKASCRCFMGRSVRLVAMGRHLLSTRFFSKNQHNILHLPAPSPPPSLFLEPLEYLEPPAQKNPPDRSNRYGGIFSFLSYHLQHRPKRHHPHKPHITMLVHSIEPQLIHIPHPRHHHPQLILAVIFKVQPPHYVVHMKQELVRTAPQQSPLIFRQQIIQF